MTDEFANNDESWRTPGKPRISDGPWIINDDWIDTIDGEAICHFPEEPTYDLYRKSNLALISAAPDLLAALDAIFNGSGMTGDNMDLARAAIAKAKGES